MRDKMGLSKVELFPKSSMRWLAARYIPVFKKRVEGGLDKDGKAFDKYTESYAEYKSTGFKSKRTGKRIPSMKERSLNRKIHPPNLHLSGLMLKNLKRTGYTKTEFSIGFRGEPAEKVQWNRDMGRNIIDDIPNKEKDFLVKLLGKEIDKQFGKLKNVTITIGK